MALIRGYSDDLYCNKKTFRITSIIWGTPDACESYEKEIVAIIGSSRKALGMEFKELHAVNLNQKNWTKLSPVYGQVLSTLVKFIGNGT